MYSRELCEIGNSGFFTNIPYKVDFEHMKTTDSIYKETFYVEDELICPNNILYFGIGEDDDEIYIPYFKYDIYGGHLELMLKEGYCIVPKVCDTYDEACDVILNLMRDLNAQVSKESLDIIRCRLQARMVHINEVKRYIEQDLEIYNKIVIKE